VNIAVHRREKLTDAVHHLTTQWPVALTIASRGAWCFISPHTVFELSRFDTVFEAMKKNESFKKLLLEEETSVTKIKHLDSPFKMVWSRHC
jgi:hypothetical protein